MFSASLVVPEKRQTSLLANFTNGALNSKHADRLNINLYTSEQTGPGKRRQKQMLIAETDKISYVGKNFGPQSLTTQHCSYYVGIRDKKTGKMTICDAELFPMIPKFPDEEDSDLDDVDSSKAKIPKDLKFSQKNDRLTEAFGSKKKQKAMESRLKNKVKSEHMEAAMGTAVKRALNEDMHIQHNVSETENSLTPPCNKEAMTPSQVYGLSDIINDKEMEELTTAAQVFYNCNHDIIKQWKQEEKYPHFILNHLSVLPLSEKERWHKVKCLKYLHFMISLYNLRSFRAKPSMLPLPEDLPDKMRKSLLDRFTLVMENGSKIVRCRPVRLKDKLLSYILVLCLLIDEFEVEFSDLLSDLQVKIRRMQAVFGTLGCKVWSKKGQSQDGMLGDVKSHHAALRIPLTFKEPFQKRKR